MQQDYRDRGQMSGEIAPQDRIFRRNLPLEMLVQRSICVSPHPDERSQLTELSPLGQYYESARPGSTPIATNF